MAKRMSGRRSPSRIYKVANGQIVEIVKEWSMKYGANLYYVQPWTDSYPKIPIAKCASFAEARQVVRDLANDELVAEGAFVMLRGGGDPVHGREG